jgi:hypothetical protein
VPTHRAGAQSFTRRVAVGAALLVLAAFAWFLHVNGERDGQQSWDSGSPPATVTLRTGNVYYLSTTGGIGPASAAFSADGGSLSCTYSDTISKDVALSVTPVTVDNRILHRVASFIAPSDLPMSITCDAIGPVYVDDATSAAFDRSGLFVILTILLGFLGVIWLLRGLMAAPSFAPKRPEPERTNVMQ